MEIRKHKRGFNHEIGDEVTFYQEHQVRVGTISFVGSDSVSVYPITAEVLGVEGEPMRDIEYTVKKEDVL